MIQISPSVLACDFTKLGEEVEDIRRGGAEMVHLDVMDGMFVPNISFGIPVIASLRKKTDMVFDVHLMIEKPERYFVDFIKAGADIVTFHYEASDDPAAALKSLRDAGVKASISIKPKTPADKILPLLPLCDMVLVMTVEPGFGGQKLIPETLDKVTELKREIDRLGLDVEIEVDGGIDASNAKAARDAGATVLVAGSAVFRPADRKAAIEALRA